LEIDMQYQTARERFAEANGWRYSKSRFTLDALMRGIYSGGKSDREAGYITGSAPSMPFDHGEYFRLPRSAGSRPVAIMGHNYPGVDNQLRKLVAQIGGYLVLHEPPAGKAASWYYPGGTLPMCVTRLGFEVVWPTEAEMVENAADYAAEIERRSAQDRAQDRYYAERSARGA
jgi:hypothetical protein